MNKGYIHPLRYGSTHILCKRAKNIYIFIPSNVVSEVFVAIFVAGIMITVALTVVYITLDKMLKESEE